MNDDMNFQIFQSMIIQIDQSQWDLDLPSGSVLYNMNLVTTLMDKISQKNNHHTV